MVMGLQQPSKPIDSPKHVMAKLQASPAGQSKSREGGRGGPSGKHLDGVELEVDACFK